MQKNTKIDKNSTLDLLFSKNQNQFYFTFRIKNKFDFDFLKIKINFIFDSKSKIKGFLIFKKSKSILFSGPAMVCVCVNSIRFVCQFFKK